MLGINLSHIFLLLPLLANGAATKHSGPEKPVPVSVEHFEGVIDLTVAMESGNGDLTLSLSGDMAKLDMQITINPFPEPIRLAVLMNAKTPKSAYLISDRTKTYSVIILPDPEKLKKDGAKEAKYKAKVLGEEKILGFVCSHVILSRDRELIDTWITKDIPDVYGVLKRLQDANPQIGEAALFRALEETGNVGLPMRCIVIRDGQRVTTEVRKVERKVLPSSLFAIPTDYARTEGGAVETQPTPAQIDDMKRRLQGAGASH